MDEADPEPARRYPPLQRTPPDYQTVIKFLLMASILDSVWVSGPPTVGTPCSMAQTGAVGRPGRRPLDLNPSGGSAVTTPANHNNATAGHPLPSDVQESLRHLNISTEDCFRDPDTLRMGVAAPIAIRVLSVLLFNAFIVWSNFGAVLVVPAAQRTPPIGGAMPVGATPVNATPVGATPPIGSTPIGAAPSRRPDGGSGLGPDIDLARREMAARSAAALEQLASEKPPAESAAAAVASSTAGCWRALASVEETCRINAPSASEQPRSTSAEDDLAEDSSRMTTIASRVFVDALVDAPPVDANVPWLTQLVYVATLVVVVVGMPCCPAVFENACSFLIC